VEANSGVRGGVRAAEKAPENTIRALHDDDNDWQVNDDVDEVLSLILQLQQMRQQRVSKRVPPSDYLCHLCFQKGHFIKDCPQVALELVLASCRVMKVKAHYLY